MLIWLKCPFSSAFLGKGLWVLFFFLTFSSYFVAIDLCGSGWMTLSYLSYSGEFHHLMLALWRIMWKEEERPGWGSGAFELLPQTIPFQHFSLKHGSIYRESRKLLSFLLANSYVTGNFISVFSWLRAAMAELLPCLLLCPATLPSSIPPSFPPPSCHGGSCFLHRWDACIVYCYIPCCSRVYDVSL